MRPITDTEMVELKNKRIKVISALSPIQAKAFLDSRLKKLEGAIDNPYMKDIIAEEEYRTLVAELECLVEGHDLMDVSSGGPDHGNMDHECVRCGQYFRVPLY